MSDGCNVGLFLIGIAVVIIITVVWQDSSARNCAEEHNVYDCEIQWVPVKGADE